MARIFITGSSQGLGYMAAELLLGQGHAVTVHARNRQRADELRAKLPAAESVVVGDLSTIRETLGVAEQCNALGTFDAVIHNAAVGYREPRRVETEDGLSEVFAVNSLAPYLLTAAMHRPARLVYVSSELHRKGDTSLHDLQWTDRRWNGTRAYSDTKLHNVLLAFAVARHWPQCRANALEPGWVATRMGGPSARDDLKQAHLTQSWLATGDDAAAAVSGGYFFHLRPRDPLPATRRVELQEAFLSACAAVSGIPLPSAETVHTSPSRSAIP